MRYLIVFITYNVAFNVKSFALQPRAKLLFVNADLAVLQAYWYPANHPWYPKTRAPFKAGPEPSEVIFVSI